MSSSDALTVQTQHPTEHMWLQRVLQGQSIEEQCRGEPQHAPLKTMLLREFFSMDSSSRIVRAKRERLFLASWADHESSSSSCLSAAWPSMVHSSPLFLGSSSFSLAVCAFCPSLALAASLCLAFCRAPPQRFSTSRSGALP